MTPNAQAAYNRRLLSQGARPFPHRPGVYFDFESRKVRRGDKVVHVVRMGTACDDQGEMADVDSGEELASYLLMKLKGLIDSKGGPEGYLSYREERHLIEKGARRARNGVQPAVFEPDMLAYAHNGSGFDLPLSGLPRCMRGLGFSVEAMPLGKGMSHICRIDLNGVMMRLDIMDTYVMTGLSLEKLAEPLGLSKLGTGAHSLIMTDEACRKYNRQDVLILKAVVEDLHSSVSKLNVGGHHRTPASLAKAIWLRGRDSSRKRHYDHNTDMRIVRHAPGSFPHKLERFAMGGGVIETLVFSEVEDASVIDRNSSYAAECMNPVPVRPKNLNKPEYLSLTKEELLDKLLDDDSCIALADCYVRIPELKDKVLWARRMVPEEGGLYGDGYVRAVGTVRICSYTPFFKLLRELGGHVVKVRRVQAYEKGYALRGAAEAMWRMRQGGGVMGALGKALLFSLVGSLGQKSRKRYQSSLEEINRRYPEKDGHAWLLKTGREEHRGEDGFMITWDGDSVIVSERRKDEDAWSACPAINGYVTCAAAVSLNRAANAILERGGEVIHVNTDGMVVDPRGAEIARELGMISPELGMWKAERAGAVRFINNRHALLDGKPWKGWDRGADLRFDDDGTIASTATRLRSYVIAEDGVQAGIEEVVAESSVKDGKYVKGEPFLDGEVERTAPFTYDDLAKRPMFKELNDHIMSEADYELSLMDDDAPKPKGRRPKPFDASKLNDIYDEAWRDEASVPDAQETPLNAVPEAMEVKDDLKVEEVKGTPGTVPIDSLPEWTPGYAHRSDSFIRKRKRAKGKG